MAVTELWSSREMHITKEGTTITRLFSCSNTDWDAGGDEIITLPIIGEKYSDARPDLCVTDKRNRWRSNTECVVEVTYSRGGLNYPTTLPDTRSSLVPTFDFSFQPHQLIDEDAFWDYENNTSKQWKIHFQETYENKPPPPVPEPAPHIVWTIKMNVSKWNWNMVNALIGCVNSEDMLAQYKKTMSRPPEWLDITGDDKGHWLFVGFNAIQMGNGNMQLTQIFQYSGIRKWNEPYGVADMHMYRTADLLALPYPVGEDDAVDNGLRG